MSTFAGSIIDGRYQPPAGQFVTWKRGWTTNDPLFPSVLTFQLNPAVAWNGEQEGAGAIAYFDRYAEGHGDRVAGMWISAAPPHGEGLEYVILKELLGGREPTTQERTDFSIANNGPLGSPDYERILGHKDPSQQGAGSELPLRIDDSSRPYGDVWRLADGRLVINIHGGSERPQIVLPAPAPPVAPPPETPPVPPPTVPPTTPPETPPAPASTFKPVPKDVLRIIAKDDKTWTHKDRLRLKAWVEGIKAVQR
jgi:hypothetical protein